MGVSEIPTNLTRRKHDLRKNKDRERVSGPPHHVSAPRRHVKYNLRDKEGLCSPRADVPDSIVKKSGKENRWGGIDYLGIGEQRFYGEAKV
jgi:hypothetical protein